MGLNLMVGFKNYAKSVIIQVDFMKESVSLGKAIRKQHEPTKLQ